MPQKYAPAVEAILNALKALIDARAQADGITVGEVVIGEKAKDSAFVDGGIYILLPSDRDARHVAGSKREPMLHIPVTCIHRGDGEDLPSTLATLRLESLVKDAVLANPNLSGTCMVAQVTGSETETADLEDVTIYATTVTVAARMSHGTT